MKESITEVMHSTVKGLHKAGLVDRVTMAKFDALCLPTVRELTPAEIADLRERHNLSQAVFAHYLSIPTSTVQKWEQGQKKPSGPSLKLLNIVERKGLEALL